MSVTRQTNPLLAIDDFEQSLQDGMFAEQFGLPGYQTYEQWSKDVDAVFGK
jgi:hypothetical protein